MSRLIWRGLVGGLALSRALERLGISPALGLDGSIAHALGAAGHYLAILASSGLPLSVLSALLATVPDIDEPGSFIARRAHAVITLTGVGLAGGVAALAKLSPTIWLLALLVGALLGRLAGYVALRLIRRAAGGHRRLTHSLVLTGMLALAAGGLWRCGLGAWALIPAGLAWAILIHDLGDLVTPAGVPLLYPFSRTSFHLLPAPICRVGEPLVALAASVGGLLLLGGL